MVQNETAPPEQSEGATPGAAEVHFTLPAVMTIETADDVAAELRQLSLADHTHLILDASQLETLTTPGMQLLLATARTLSAHGGHLTIHHSKDDIITSVEDLGLYASLYPLPI